MASTATKRFPYLSYIHQLEELEHELGVWAERCTKHADSERDPQRSEVYRYRAELALEARRLLGLTVDQLARIPRLG